MNRGVKEDNNSHSESRVEKVRGTEAGSMNSNLQFDSSRVKEVT